MLLPWNPKSKPILDYEVSCLENCDTVLSLSVRSVEEFSFWLMFRLPSSNSILGPKNRVVSTFKYRYEIVSVFIPLKFPHSYKSLYACWLWYVDYRALSSGLRIISEAHLTSFLLILKSSTKIWSSNIRRYLTELSEKNLRLEDFDQCYKVYTTSIRSTLIKSVGVKVTSQISNYYEKVLQNPPYSIVTTTSQLFWFKSIPQANHCR